MAQEFLDQLLRTENTVQLNNHKDSSCMICLQPYGTLNSSTGAVEVQVRLPCSHLVGSFCIATWLQDNNSCPVCRRKFFPAQPRPCLEHGIMSERRSSTVRERGRHEQYSIIIEPTEGLGENHPFNPFFRNLTSRRGARRIVFRDETELLSTCEWFCGHLRLGREIEEMACSIIKPLLRMLQNHGHSADCISAMSVYVAWHLSNADGDVAEFLANLSDTSDVSQAEIRSTYRNVHFFRNNLIVPDVLPGLARRHMDRILAFLPTPDPENGTAEGEEENSGEGGISEDAVPNPTDFAEVDEQNWYVWAEIHEKLAAALGNAELLDRVLKLSGYILWSLNHHSGTFHGSAQYKEAICVFTASHMMIGEGMSYSDVADVYGVSERALRKGYRYIFSRRNELLDFGATVFMNTHRVLNALPALRWPSPRS